MDILIKNNIIKRNKLIIDVGMFETKVLEVHYEAKKITITEAQVFSNHRIVGDDGVDFVALASNVEDVISGAGRNDVSISLPSELCESKIISIKNKKKSEIPKILKKDYMTFGRVNPITHIVDYAFLGTREEEGDTVSYYLLSAVQKSMAAELVSAFEKNKLKVKTVVSSVYNQICLSELFFDEYEHLNRLFIDFGSNTIRITAFSEGIAVYTRSIDIGFNAYIKSLFSAQENAGKPEIIKALINVGEDDALDESTKKRYFTELNFDTYTRCVDEIDTYIINEISRVIDLCSKNELDVSKIYYTGNVIKDFDKKLSGRLGVQTEHILFHRLDEKEGKGYVLEVDDTDFSGTYSNAVGLCVYPML